MRRYALLLPFALAVSGAAAQPRPGIQTLQMDPDHASVGVTLGGAKSRFTQAAGALQYDPASPEKSTIARSLDTSSIEASAARQPFDPDHFPELRIISTAAAKSGKDGVESLPVNVTIRDITRPVTFLVSFKNGGPVIAMHAEGTVHGADFHMMGKTGDVVLVIDAPFVRVGRDQP